MRSLAMALVFLAATLAPAHLGVPALTEEGLVLVRQEAEARRFGGGRSFGFRGSRGLFGGARSFRPRGFMPRSRLGARPRAYRGFRRRGFGGGLFGGMGGFLLGGLLGSLLFGGMGYGGGGFGLIGILLIVGVLFFALRFLRGLTGLGAPARPRYAGADPYGVGDHEEPGPRAPRGGVYRGPDIASRGGGPRAGAAAEARPDARLEEGLGEIARTDPAFSREDFLAEARQNFLRFQEAWVARDIAPIRELLDADIAAACERDLEALRREGRINRLDRIEIRALEIAEAWQEEGFDFVTVRCEASLYDYVVSESTGEILEGSREEPVAFAEHWTWARPAGPGRWLLSAIEQV